MNFDPVGRTKDGELFMKFHTPFTIVEKIQLLERWILVQSFIYYELDQNIVADHDYDNNAKQLAELKKEYPEEFKRSRYYDIFHDYCSEEDGTVNTSGFFLLERVRQLDKQLYRYIWMDAIRAIDMKQKHLNSKELRY
jgi:hypothetical protein